MAEDTAGTAPAIDYEKLGAAIAASLAPAIGEANKPLLERLDKLATPATQAAAAADPGAKAKPLSADDITKIVSDQLKTFQQGQQTQAAREGYLASKMNDLPAAYRNQMPNTADAAELARAEQQIRQQFQADFKAAGGTTQTVAGNPPAGAAKPGAAVDTSKLSSVDKIALGLKQDGAVPLRPGQAAPAAGGPEAAAK
jgi:hypothetical protein